MANDVPTSHTLVPDILVVGNACIDRQLPAQGGLLAAPEKLPAQDCEIGQARAVERLGGASAFAAQVAAQAGAQVGMVAASGPNFSRLQALGDQSGIWLKTQTGLNTTVFDVYGSGPGQTRRERVISAAAPLSADAVPEAWAAAPVAYVAPVLDECTGAMVAALRSPIVVVGAQGWLRRFDAHGWVQFAATAEFARPPGNVTAMIFSEADHPQAHAAATDLCAQGILVVLTQSSQGGLIFEPRSRRPQRYRAVAATEQDTTGAGDCFGVVFALALSQKRSVKVAAALAAQAAARVVEGPELGSLPQANLPLLFKDANRRRSTDRSNFNDARRFA